MRVLSEVALAATLSSLPVQEPWVVASGNYAPPRTLLEILDAALPSYRLFMLNAQGGMPVRTGVTLETPFVGAGMRDQPTLDYIPSRLSLVPVMFRTTRAPDLVLLHTSMPRSGTVSMGVEVNILPAAVGAARARGGLVVAQLNPRMPYTYGDGQLALEDIDLAIEGDDDLLVPAVRPPDAVSQGIGERVAALVPDGATLQLGIGAVPDATLASLAGRRGLKLWSETFSDGLLRLDRAGALDPEAPIVASFVFGSTELYDWLDQNKRVRVLRTEKTNDPALIAQRQHMVSVNGALQVDLFAQANASAASAGSTPASAARPTSSSARCTHRAARRSSRCRLGTRGPTARRWCRRSRPRLPPSSTATSSASRAARPSGDATSASRPVR